MRPYLRNSHTLKRKTERKKAQRWHNNSINILINWNHIINETHQKIFCSWMLFRWEQHTYTLENRVIGKLSNLSSHILPFQNSRLWVNSWNKHNVMYKICINLSLLIIE
jgi:hypothetical protein